MKVIEATRTTTAPAVQVWALLADAPAWAQWGAWNEVFVEGGGAHERGAIRVVVKPPLRVRERVTEWVPGERMSYEIVDGMKVQGYRSTVTLEGRPDGSTLIRWRSEYEKAGPLTAIILRGAVRDACRRLAKAASAG
jgi:uncharacterized protein YndB with AHSA1/START domain